MYALHKFVVTQIKVKYEFYSGVLVCWIDFFCFVYNQSEFSILYIYAYVFSDAITNKAEYFLLRGRTLNVIGKYTEEANESLSKAVKLAPKSVEAWNQLGECFWKKGDMEGAKNCFTGALQHVSCEHYLMIYFYLCVCLCVCLSRFYGLYLGNYGWIWIKRNVGTLVGLIVFKFHKIRFSVDVIMTSFLFLKLFF